MHAKFYTLLEKAYDLSERWPVAKAIRNQGRKYVRQYRHWRRGPADFYGSYFEVHLAYACNLTCDSCSHFSNYRFSGVLSLEKAESWYRQWAPRLQPSRITLLGGEPAINPKLCEHLHLVRKYWPNAQISLVSNGLLLSRHPLLPQTLVAIGNTELHISRHYDQGEYARQFAEVLELMASWRSQYGLQIAINDSFADWTLRYHDKNGVIKPFQDNNPYQSWKICHAKKCMQLYDGKLWKCPILAYLPMLKQKREIAPEWNPAFTYQALEANCSAAELDEFMSRREESFCGLCPANRLPLQKSNPLPAVKSMTPASVGGD